MELARLLDCAADVRASSRLKYSIPHPEIVYKDIRCQETIKSVGLPGNCTQPDQPVTHGLYLY